MPKLQVMLLELSSQFYKLFGDEWSVTLERDKHEARLVPQIPKSMDPDHFYRKYADDLAWSRILVD